MTRLLDAQQSVLMVVDIQERFVPVIYECDRVIKNSSSLIQACKILDIPVLFTEQ